MNGFRPRPLVVAAAGIAAAAIAAVLALRPRALPAQLRIEEVVTELHPTPDMGVRTDRLQPGYELRADAGPRDAVIAPPPSRLRYRVRVPAGVALRFGVGVQGDGERDRERTDVRFVVQLDGRPVFSRAINPAARRGDRRWFDERVDLGVREDREVEITLETEAARGDRRLSGTPGWSHVRLVRDTWRRRQPALPGTPNVLVLLIDTLRADSLGCYGAVPSPSPTLDRLAQNALVFENAIAQAPWTMPSVASILTGLYPRSHGVVGDPLDGGSGQGQATFLSDTVRTLAEHAADAGISTVGISANPLVSRATNYAHGFETFTELEFDMRDDGSGERRKNWATAAEVNAEFLRWLRLNRGYRFFAYLHYMEPHHPYTPPARLRPPLSGPIRTPIAHGHLDQWLKQILSPEGLQLPQAEVEYLQRLYTAEIRAWDEELGPLLDALHGLGLSDSTVLVVTSDHGEEFLEHGRLMHGAHLYDETLHVPLVIRGPGVRPGRVSEQAQGIDLFPTVASVLGLPPVTGLSGRSLLGPGEPRVVFSETRNGRLPDGVAASLVSLRTATWKLIHAPDLERFELYDLARDPGERTNRFGAAAEGLALTEQVRRFEATAPPQPAVAGEVPGMRARLRALGYVE